MSDDEYYGDSPYFDDDLYWDDDGSQDLADDLAEHTMPSPVYIGKVPFETVSLPPYQDVLRPP